MARAGHERLCLSAVDLLPDVAVQAIAVTLLRNLSRQRDGFKGLFTSQDGQRQYTGRRLPASASSRPMYTARCPVR